VPHLKGKIKVLSVDANSGIESVLEAIKRRNSLSVTLVDPNGLDIHFETVKKLGEFPSMDLIINFSIFDLKRNEQDYRSGTSKADDFFGTREWRQRTSREWLKLYKNQLRSLGFIGIEGENEGLITVKGPSGAPIYHLIYASKHRRGLDFWQKTKSKYQEIDLFNE
jgi:three-Cys-motif partner protein